MGKKKDKIRKKALRNQSAVEFAAVPLLEHFSVADDVFTEPDAFDAGQIHKSLGRLYRSWLDTRELLDPEFNRARYRYDIKARSKKKPSSPLGREQLAKASPKSSTAPRSTSEKSQKSSAKREKRTR